MKNVADISERQTALSPLADEAWADEVDLPAAFRERLLIKHVQGPLFFGFARGFLDIAARAAGGRLLVLRMDRVSMMDQSGAYALHDALVDLKSSGTRIVLVGLPVAQRDILEAIHVIPELVSTDDLFSDFGELKSALPKVLTEIGATASTGATEVVPASVRTEIQARFPLRVRLKLLRLLISQARTLEPLPRARGSSPRWW